MFVVVNKKSGIPVAYSNSFREALHYLNVYNQDSPHELKEVVQE